MRVDKRVHPRVDVWLEVSFESSRELITSYMSNISKGGMFIQTREVLDLGEILALTFQLPGQDNVIRIKGKVVWKTAPGTTINAGMGIQFAEMPEEDRHMLEGFIQAEIEKK